MHLIDTHSHIYGDQFTEDIDLVVARCLEQGVKQVVLPNIDVESISQVDGLTAKFPDVMHPMMGLHPCSVKENYLDELKVIKNALDKGNYCGIGEIGIDLYWDKTFLNEQKEAFKIQCGWAVERKQPIVIHVRDSFDEIFEVLDEIHTPELFGVFHCFTGTLAQAEKILSYKNFKMGVGGVLTFKNSGVDKVIADIDLEHLILETDAPYLTPTPYRGKRNESSYTALVAQKLAEVKGVPIEEIAAQTTQTAKEIFNI